MIDVKEVAENIYMIDDQLFSVPEWGSVYLINEEKKALVDTGPSTSVNIILEGIKKVGVSPKDIDYLIITHIHLDHAGGAGVLIRGMPQAQIIVHYKGARHLVNPTRLISSMVAVQGEEVRLKYGEVVPIEAHRVKAVYGGDVIKLSEKQILTVIDAPGHAQHELCIYESGNRGVFTGDAAGISVVGHKILLPASPPPNFDLELYVNTLEKLVSLKPTTIYYAHFGVSDQAEEKLRLAIAKVQSWEAMLTGAVTAGGFDDVPEKIMAQLAPELELAKGNETLYGYLTKNNLKTSIAGYVKYYKEKHGLS